MVWPAIVAMVVYGPEQVAAQTVRSLEAGVELERYLRALQLVGEVQPIQWSLRGFGPAERAKLGPVKGPWISRAIDAASGNGRVHILDASAQAIVNTSMPYGFNDGPVWAGKGVTLQAQGGASGRFGPMSYEIAPVAFVAQNAAFTLAETGTPGNGRFSDFLTPAAIDEPQRFGDRPYARIDAGNTTLRIERFGLTAGVTSAAEWWGPASEHPIVLGNNAGGFPRIFAGTAAPFRLGWFKFHGRLLWGRVDVSRVAIDTGLNRLHFVTGLAGVMQISGAPGLELGAGRLFHVPWSRTGWQNLPWTRSFQQFIKGDQASLVDTIFGRNPDNQLASAFLRWAPPEVGAEVYGEFGRDDRNSELQDLAQEPDHISAYLLGIARVWKNERSRTLTVVRGEVLNSRMSRLVQGRAQEPWYVHNGSTSHGHTQHGQVLGSAGGHGGGATALVVDRYTDRGRLSLRWDRISQATPRSQQGLPISGRVDVTHALSVERLLFRRASEVTAAATLVKEFNRHFNTDAWNLRLSTNYRWVR